MANNPNARNNLIPATKGEVRNPKGKPKGIPNTKTRLKRLLEITQDLTNPITGVVEGFTVMEQLDLQQVIKARKGDSKAYEIILDRLEGKVANDPEVATVNTYNTFIQQNNLNPNAPEAKELVEDTLEMLMNKTKRGSDGQGRTKS